MFNISFFFHAQKNSSINNSVAYGHQQRRYRGRMHWNGWTRKEKKFNKVNSFVDFSAFCVVEICGKLLSFYAVCCWFRDEAGGDVNFFYWKFSMFDAVFGPWIWLVCKELSD